MKGSKILIYLVLLSFCFIAVAYFGIQKNYALTGDLLSAMSNVKEVSKVGFRAFDFTAQDFHNDAFFVIQNFFLRSDLIGLSRIHFTASVFSYLSEESSSILTNLYFVGFLAIILFVFSSFLLYRSLFGSDRGALLFTILLLVLTEIPLIRWSGIISLHGLTYNFYLPQFFALSFFFLSVYTTVEYLKNKSIKWIFFASFFSLVVILLHILTGLFLILILISIGAYCLFNNQRIIGRNIIIGTLVSFILSHFWPLYSVLGFLSETNSYLILVLSVGLSFLGIYVYGYLARMNNFKLPEMDLSKALILLLIFSIVMVQLVNSGILDSHLSFSQVNSWYLSFLPLLLAFVLILPNFMNKGRGFLLFLILYWCAISFGPYLLGYVGLPLKTYWRFLFFGKIPLVFLVSWAFDKVTERKKYIVLIYSLFVLLVFLFTFTNVVNSSVGRYYGNVPVEYKLPEVLVSSNVLVLSDPTTNYHLEGLTKNKVVSLPEDKVSDVDYEENIIRIGETYKMLFDPLSNKDLLRTYSPKFILFNKKFNQEDVSDFTKISLDWSNASEISSSFDNFDIIYNDDNFILLESRK
ncbi:MAG: hypothetical protein KJ718_01810 [Nanoarchaeota archaeon]|nr:hypothetical protein [Nanoarchaeota archaeon]